MTNNMILAVTLILLLPLIALMPAVTNAQSEGTLDVFIKSENGDRVAPGALSMKVFRGLDTSPLQEFASVVENPTKVGSLQVGQRYKIEIYMNSMYAGVGFIDLKTQHDKIDITIKNTGGLRLNLFYKDGQTPLQNAGVSIKSHDGRIWSHSETDANGNTLRVWLHPAVRPGDYYYAEVLLAKGILYTSPPIRLQPNVAQEFRIVTDWPTVVDKLITVDVYANPQTKVGRQDGTFVAEVYDRKNNKVADSPVIDSGVAYFSKMPVNNYYLYIKSKDASGALQTVATKSIIITEASDRIPIYLNNPDLNSDHLNCNCVAFRLDDVQDYYLAPAQIAVISAFERKEMPLTLGVIGGSIGDDPALLAAIRPGILGDSGLFEIANHSWNNRVLTQMTKSDQEKLIRDANQKINAVFGVSPVTFIPPENLFNDDTISALKDNGFTHMSSSVGVKDPPPFTRSDFYQFPSIPTTATLDTATGLWEPSSNQEILDKIEMSILDYGYAVVTMHPHEFSAYERGYVNQANSTRIAHLEALLDMLKSKNVRVLPIGMIHDYNTEHVFAKPDGASADQEGLHGCNCVAFRLDNVQDFWLNDVQESVIDTFRQSKAPLTLSVIGKFIGDDPKTVNAIKDGLNKAPQIRLANRGWEHVDHTAFDRNGQAASITQTNQKIHELFGVRPNIFSPPYDAFNKDTLDAMQHSGMKYLSASTVTDPPPYKDREVRRAPSTIYFTNAVGDDPFLQGTVSQKALSKVLSGVEQYGFAIMSLQASDFAVHDGVFQNRVDNDKVMLLKSLIGDIRSRGMIIVTVDRIPSLLSEPRVEISAGVRDASGWTQGRAIDDSLLASGLGYLAAQNYLTPVPSYTEERGKNVPHWVGTAASWWSEGRITDSDFVKGTQYLIDKGIIRI